jgi:hypothetical protein
MPETWWQLALIIAANLVCGFTWGTYFYSRRVHMPYVREQLQRTRERYKREDERSLRNFRITSALLARLFVRDSALDKHFDRTRKLLAVIDGTTNVHERGVATERLVEHARKTSALLHQVATEPFDLESLTKAEGN